VSQHNQLEVVTHARILGLTISSDLKWNKHILNTIKKANKRIYFQQKRAKVPTANNFYCACIRQVLEYCCQVYHYGLPCYLSNAIERVQKRVMSIIYPNLSYEKLSHTMHGKDLNNKNKDYINTKSYKNN
jgi:hypothetical protein